MSLLLTMLPLYIFGNLHCMGMCGPLVMMLGQHRYRHMYFLGRTASFTLAGGLAGELGGSFQQILTYYQVPAFTSLGFGLLILLIGFYSIMGWHYPGYRWLSKRLAKTEKKMAILIMNDTPMATFLFGFFTVMLPCGQTMIVFSACALAGEGLVGLINGLAFSLLTSPSLWMAMRAQNFLQKMKRYYNSIMGVLALVVGLLACFRGLAELGYMSHLILNPSAPAFYHIVVY